MLDIPARKKPNHVDIHVGQHIRMRRVMLGMSQEKLGLALGITFQQVQKYEKGTNRVGASRLQAISEALGVPVSSFFDGSPKVSEAPPPQQDPVLEFVASPEGVALITAFRSIADRTTRNQLIGVVRTVANLTRQ